MDAAKEKIRQLIRKFEAEKAAGTAYEYNESETKTGFIEPLLQALGWDTQDRKDVGLETKVSAGRVDYSLKIRGTPRVYVEAKPLRADLARPDIVEQAVTYGYNKKGVKWVLLTDFQEFRLFDVTLKPSRRNLERGLRLDLRYNEYLERFEDLWLLSKSSVESDRLDRVLLTKKAERDRLPVDKAILEDLKHWQETLAKHTYKRSNYTLDADRLREATQRILDRIIFIRSCEDRKLTHRESLRDLVLTRREEIGSDFMLILKGLFRRYDRDFNSDLFASHFSEDLPVDFSVLKEIILETYDPYLFDVVGVELLGSIYEQYLGYTINLTEKRVKYELRPEVRKAGGVYYTPEYIVGYIVRNTVGRLLADRGKSRAAKVKQTPIRVLDMACGSGSFLIGAYDELSRHYQALKAEVLKRKTEVLRAARADQIGFPLAVEEEQEVSRHLTILEKRQMVLDHLFGVDMDPQACEIARLSLMLKMLEDEYGFVPGRAVLPLLDYNIQCGNSLISGDVLKLQSFFREDWIRTKPFDWDVHFGKITREGGFDAIIGNPPYVRIQDLQTWAPAEARFYAEHFESAGKGNFDIFLLFIEQGLKLLKPKGLLSFIVTKKFFQTQYAQALRKILAEGKHVAEIVDFSYNQVFDESFVNTCIILLTKAPSPAVTYIEIPKLEDTALLPPVVVSLASHPKANLEPATISRVRADTLSEGPWVFVRENEQAILTKIRAGHPTLEQVTARIFQGLKTSADKIYILQPRGETARRYKAYSTYLDEEVDLEKDLLRPLIKGGEMKPFIPAPWERLILFPYEVQDDEARLIPKRMLEDRFPRTWEYLLACKKYLEDREGGRMKGPEWYAYGRSQALEVMGKPKLITPDLARSASFSYDPEGRYYFAGGAAGGYGIVPKDFGLAKYLLALLNSRALDWYVKKTGTRMESGFFSFEARFIKHVPIRFVDSGKPQERKLYDDLVALVDVMLALRQRFEKAVGTEKDQLQRQIEKTYREIDGLAYKLYGITNQERAIIEAEG